MTEERIQSPPRTDPTGDPAPRQAMRSRVHTASWMRASVVLLGAAALAMTVGCSPQAEAVAAAFTDKAYAVSPDAMTVTAGIVSGSVTEMKVVERVEDGSGRVLIPARLTAKLVLKNTSADQSVRLLGAKIVYVDAQGTPLKFEAGREEPTMRIAASYGSPDRLDPGQDARQTIDTEFPVVALKSGALKAIHVELSYIPTPYKEETLQFAVSIAEDRAAAGK